MFLGKEIVIPSDTNQESLCKVLFKDKKSMCKVWDWDEMLEKWGDEYTGAYEKRDWRKVYDAAREVNQKVAAKTAVEDLLIATAKTVAVNPKYPS